jgi:DNA-binding GntR family transcriptional regulator
MSIETRIPLSMAIPENLAKLLEDEIVLGRLAPNTRLTEEEVAARYSVSRSPVREALRLIERDGLVLRAARRGIWVAPLSLRDFDEIYACRIELEGLAAAQAAQSLQTEKKLQLAGVLREMRDAQQRGDAQEFFLVDVRGSFMIYDLADNATLARLLGSLEKQALRYRFYAYERNPLLIQASLDGTSRIFDAIVAGDADEARRQTQDLIREIWQVMRAAIADSFGDEA